MGPALLLIFGGVLLVVGGLTIYSKRARMDKRWTQTYFGHGPAGLFMALVGVVTIGLGVGLIATGN